MQDFIFLYTKPIKGENTPYIYRADFEESGPSTYSLLAPHHSLTPSKASHLGYANTQEKPHVICLHPPSATPNALDNMFLTLVYKT